MDRANCLTRRELLHRAGSGVGLLGLVYLLHEQGMLATAQAMSLENRALNPLAPRPSHYRDRAKSVIWIFINGGPSQVDTWDYKPGLAKWDGKTMRQFDPSFKNTTGFFANQVGALMRSPFRFSPRGQCGKMVAEIFPCLGEHVDKMAFIHSGFTESNNHSPALFMMNTGFARMGRPCVGSWVAYGLGTESRNLPGFVVMSDPRDAACRKAMRPTGGLDSCQACTRELIFGQPGSRSTIWFARPKWLLPSSGHSLTCFSNSTNCTGNATRQKPS
jgi:hypothetical protein